LEREEGKGEGMGRSSEGGVIQAFTRQGVRNIEQGDNKKAIGVERQTKGKIGRVETIHWNRRWALRISGAWGGDPLVRGGTYRAPKQPKSLLLLEWGFR